MNSVQGMAVDEVRKMAAQLGQAATEIDRIQKELTQGLTDVDWTGPDADKFRQHWQSEMVPALHQIASTAHDLQQTASQNANEQAATSSH